MPASSYKRVWLSSDDEVRTAARAILLDIAWTGWGAGVPTGSLNEALMRPRTMDEAKLFRLIVEGRHGLGYSMCSDACGYVGASLGIRDEKFINRDDDDLDGVPDEKEIAADPDYEKRGHIHWLVARSVIMLQAGARQQGAWETADSGLLPYQGDMFLIGDDSGAFGGPTHVGSMAGNPTEDSPVLPAECQRIWKAPTVEGGAVDAGGQCIKMYESYIKLLHDGTVWISRHWSEKGRRMQGFVDITKMPREAAARIPSDCPVGEAV